MYCFIYLYYETAVCIFTFIHSKCIYFFNFLKVTLIIFMDCMCK